MRAHHRLRRARVGTRVAHADEIGLVGVHPHGHGQGRDAAGLRAQHGQPVDHAAEKLQKGLRILVSSDRPIESVSKRLEPKGDAEIVLVLMLDKDTDVEVKLPGRYKVSPQIASAIKAVPGVEQVELV